MTDPANDRATDPLTGTATRPAPAMPRWVKIFALVAAGVVLLLIGGMLIAGGEHGPGRHLGAAVTPSLLAMTTQA
jgi:hypothetical protein